MSEVLHWLFSLNPERLWALFGATLLIDGARYTALKLFVCVFWESLSGVWRYRAESTEPFLPTVAVLLSAYNEEDTIRATVESIVATYPKLEIIVVNDASTDRTAKILEKLQEQYGFIRSLSRPQRGGKSSSLNLALNYTSADVLVIADTDSHLRSDAIYRIVQPFRNRWVGAVSATLRVRNPFESIVTWCQAFEYANSIFMGRQLADKFDMLVVASGGFSAFRSAAVRSIGGWDVGPGEDGDLTLRLRKAGYRVAFEPHAYGFTNVPATLLSFLKQRRRWNRGAVRYKCRKHVDLAFFWYGNFRVSNLLCLMNCWFFQIFCTYSIFLYWISLVLQTPQDLLWLTTATYLIVFVLHLFQSLLILAHSQHFYEDLIICLIIPVIPFFNACRKVVRLVSITEEFLLRKSYDDNYVPSHVRSATWHW